MSAKCIHDGEVPVPDLFVIYCPVIFCQKFAPLLMEPQVSYERKTYIYPVDRKFFSCNAALHELKQYINKSFLVFSWL